MKNPVTAPKQIASAKTNLAALMDLTLFRSVIEGSDHSFVHPAADIFI